MLAMFWMLLLVGIVFILAVNAVVAFYHLFVLLRSTVARVVRYLALLLALLACAIFAAPLSAQREPLTAADHLLWGASSALLMADWGQTHSGLSGRTGHETNPLLGPHPSHGALNRYMVGAMIGNALVSRLHKPKQRRIVWTLVTGLQAAVVILNHRQGLGWQFRF